MPLPVLKESFLGMAINFFKTPWTSLFPNYMVPGVLFSCKIKLPGSNRGCYGCYMDKSPVEIVGKQRARSQKQRLMTSPFPTSEMLLVTSAGAFQYSGRMMFKMYLMSHREENYNPPGHNKLILPDSFDQGDTKIKYEHNR
ncbi:hypothetical protein CEXT_786081 [Caerostris extrusa]|uniref:Uncharacterized protein n=1 Tax=Caerostris extrusa TaxID=172846 RepID=A0AAV4VQ51_CAEEX|nr:hypothetical protein CEXT_786081 [Caerostris extrusa]